MHELTTDQLKVVIKDANLNGWIGLDTFSTILGLINDKQKLVRVLSAADRTLSIIRNAPGNILDRQEMSMARNTHNEIRAVLKEVSEYVGEPDMQL